MEQDAQKNNNSQYQHVFDAHSTLGLEPFTA